MDVVAGLGEVELGVGGGGSTACNYRIQFGFDIMFANFE